MHLYNWCLIHAVEHNFYWQLYKMYYNWTVIWVKGVIIILQFAVCTLQLLLSLSVMTVLSFECICGSLLLNCARCEEHTRAVPKKATNNS